MSASPALNGMGMMPPQQMEGMGGDVAAAVAPVQQAMGAYGGGDPQVVELLRRSNQLLEEIAANTRK